MLGHLARLIGLCRPLNLFIVALLQGLIYFVLVEDICIYTGLTTQLSSLNKVLLILDACIITACGYLINDYFDVQTDEYHQTKTSYKAKGIRQNELLGFYLSLLFVGLAIAFYLAWKQEEWPLLILYPLANLLLFVYSWKLKGHFIWGNLLVSFLCTVPILIILLAERETFLHLKALSLDSYPKISAFWTSIIMWVLFAFFATLIREIIKDFEDKEADAEAGLQTFVILKRERFSKGLLWGLMLVLNSLIIGFTLSLRDSTVLMKFGLITISFLVGLSAWMLYKAKEGENYKRLSQLYKGVILLGMLIIPFILKT